MATRAALMLTFVLFACGDSGAGGSDAATGGDGQGGDGQGGTPVAAGGQTTGGANEGGLNSSGSADGGGVATGGMGGEPALGGGPPLTGYGALSGACGEIDLDDLLSAEPELLENGLDFSARPAFDVSLLTAAGQEMVADGNLGGSSLYSEVFALEVLLRCDGATLLKTEGEIVYAVQGKKTDILVEIDGEKVGVSVVRAMSFPEGAPYSPADALPVLEGKLDDILQSSANVAPEDAWTKQILSVIAQTPEHAASIVSAYETLDAATRADTIVLVTVTDGEDHFIYYNN